jgi:hypothetical protein
MHPTTRKNLVWKWQHGLHALDFLATFVNFEKTLP